MNQQCLINRRISPTQRITIIAISAAICVLLTYLEFPFLTEFLKLEVSEVVVILITLMFGLKSGLSLVFIKTIVHAILKFNNPVGELVFFGASALLAVSIYLFYNYVFKHSKFQLLFSLIASTLVYAIVLSGANYLFILPFYFHASFSELNADPIYLANIFTIYIPFNLVKLTLVSILSLYLVPRISKRYC